MIKYLQNIFDDFPEVTRIISATYGSDYLFMVQDKMDRKILPEDQAQQLHHTAARLLFMCMRDCMYTPPLVDFLITRVRSPDKDDWGEAETGADTFEWCTINEAIST